MPFHLQIPQNIVNQMVDQATRENPLECCGFLAGLLMEKEKALVKGIFPLFNAARSPVLFDADPKDLFSATRAIDREGWEILAIYHSHPTSLPIPSKTDLERSYDPNVMNLILSLKKQPIEIRGWWFLPDTFQEADWEIIDSPANQ